MRPQETIYSIEYLQGFVSANKFLAIINMIRIFDAIVSRETIGK